LLTFKIN